MSLLKWEVKPVAGKETGNRKRERSPRRVIKFYKCHGGECEGKGR